MSTRRFGPVCTLVTGRVRAVEDPLRMAGSEMNVC